MSIRRDLSFTGAVATSILSLLLLVLLHQLHPNETARALPAWVQGIVHSMANPHPNREDKQGMAAGYYEDLLNTSAQVASTGSLLSGRMHNEHEWKRVAQFNHRRHRKRTDFLYFELLPDLAEPDFDGILRTNRYGMADRDYEQRPAPGTHRIAFIGDSLTRGLGTAMEERFEELLEAGLNADFSPWSGHAYEILNFAVAGYRITQMLEVAITKVPEFEPDLYVLCLSDLTVSRKWCHHLAQLVHEGIDLKYDFLREVVRETGLQPDHPVATFDARLAPARLGILEAILSRIKADVGRQGAHLVALLLPTASPVAPQRQAFRDAIEVIEGLHIPTIDLLGAFQDTLDFRPYQIRPGDLHPNAAGHRLIFEELRRVIETDPLICELFAGSPP